MDLDGDRERNGNEWPTMPPKSYSCAWLGSRQPGERVESLEDLKLLVP